MKFFAGAALACAVVGSAIAIGVTGKTITPQVENKQNSAPQNEPIMTSPNPPTDFKVEPVEGPSTAFGKGKIDRTKLKPYEFKLLPQYQAIEDSKYSINAVNQQVKTALEGLNEPYLTYTADFANAVYNLVQVYDEVNKDQIVAGRTPQKLALEGSSEYALLYLEGGPIGDATAEKIRYMAASPYYRTFLINEAQFGILPRQVVGSHGVKAQGNYYMDRLRGSDKTFLKRYKELYDEGRMGDTALFWALAGDLDLTMVRLFAASSLAVDIVASARIWALTQQLRGNNYSRVSLAGFSYGFPLGLQALLINPEVIPLLYKIELGANVVTESYDLKELNERWFSIFDPQAGWNRWMFDFGDLYDTTNGIRTVLNDENNKAVGEDFRKRATIYNAKDDEVIEKVQNGMFSEKGRDNQKFWENEVRVPYYLYEEGGHSVGLNDIKAQAAAVGLRRLSYHYTPSNLNEDLVEEFAILARYQMQAILPDKPRLKT